MPEPIDHPITARDESHERDLNRHRASEQRSVRTETIGRLGDRGIDIDNGASDELVVELLEAVEAFEQAVEARGADLMVDTPPSRQPDDPRFVLPRRAASEPLADYTARIRDAADRLLSPRAD